MRISGLTKEEVAIKMEKGETNKPLKPLTRSLKRIFYDNIFTLFNMINVVIACFIIYTGSYKNLVFLGVILTNIFIGIVQEIRAKKNIDRLSILSQLKLTVIRQGEKEKVTPEQIVQNDVLYVTSGEQLCVDGHVLETTGLEVDESQLTGEADPVFKYKGDQVLSGSYIVSGNAYLEATAIGEESYAAKLSMEVKRDKKINSELLEMLQKIIRVLSFAIFPIGILLFVSNHLQHVPINQSILGSSAAIIGIIPEGLMLITSIALAVGIVHLSRKKVLVKRMGSIETLARVDVLCLDKTGTITDGHLKVLGTILENGVDEEQMEAVMGAALHSLADNNPTSLALSKYFATPPLWQADHVVPFSSARKWSGVHYQEAGSIVFGAPEYVLPNLTDVQQEKIAIHKQEGVRVLAVAQSKDNFPGNYLPSELELLGFILLKDTLRSEAVQTLAYFKEQDVSIRVISGDDPQTVSHIALQAGVENAERFIDMSQLALDADLTEIVAYYRVFGRVSPEQKKYLIQALKKEGHTVGMTGDGVNDILALREADCSIAMASGSDAAKSVSDFVLLDSNFDGMVGVVMEGRRVVNNIQRVASLYLTKTVYSAILAVLFIFINSPYPFQLIQLTPITALTVGIPSFFLALRPNYERIKGNFLKNVMKPALSAGVLVVLMILIITFIGKYLGFTYEQISTLSVLLTGSICLVSLVTVSYPLNAIIRGMLAAMMICFYSIFVFFQGIFSLASLWDWQMLLVAIPLLVVALPLYFWMRKLSDKLMHMQEKAS
ncbi:cation-translocating P-type ATPase [Isobaculum melis]|uniref:Cation-transporting ATPase E n=1 Tax=Isobaculum melis TaxID=142588 RepID=A0A1H9TCJ4_9LACT|nr:cation-translocating P-type ATPase [Isobaculum melis]SER95050.1 cation-transporting ATPase E [Isobaculum melis]